METEEDRKRIAQQFENSPAVGSFTAAEIRGPTLLIYRYLDTYTRSRVLFSNLSYDSDEPAAASNGSSFLGGTARPRLFTTQIWTTVSDHRD